MELGPACSPVMKLPTWNGKEMTAVKGKRSIAIAAQVSCFILFQSLAKLTDGFRNSCSLTDPLQEFPPSAGVLGESLPHQFCDAGSQTEVIGEVRSLGRGRNRVCPERKGLLSCGRHPFL